MSQDPPTVCLAPDIEAWLRNGDAAGSKLERVITTSISWVYLFEDRVLKLKKPVDFGFLDFTTPQKRRWAADRELAFNRLTAPQLYRRVLAITRDVRGRLAFDGDGELVDAAVEMARFPDEALAADLVPLSGELAEGLGRLVARAHAEAAPGAAGAGAAGIAYVIGSNAEHLRACAAGLGAEAVESLVFRTQAELSRQGGLLDARQAAGLCRACHGDLHLGNVLIDGGQPVLFDCIEFSDALREIDILYDLAFLAMDLGFRGDASGGNRMFNGWLDEAALLGLADLPGLAALPLFLAVRAGVRAHVRAREGQAGEGRRYLDLAMASFAPRHPRLLAVGGLSGAGKTTRARALAHTLGPPPGAVVLRSDEIRKRLFGRPPGERLPREAYAPEVGERVYRQMFAEARTCLAAGFSVVLDAVFLKLADRAAAGAIACEAGVPFDGLWLEAPVQVLQARLVARTGDASDADLAVLQAQLREDPGPIAWPRG